jgi:predicted ester cyclase
VAIFRLSNGKIVEQWVYPDILSMQRQLSQQAQQ